MTLRIDNPTWRTPIEWPRKPTQWIEGRRLFVSVPFTWNLPDVKALLLQRSFLWEEATVGGPAVKLLPDYLAGIPRVQLADDLPGVLQRVNPQATRTTIGCIRRCNFCGIGKQLIEQGPLVELGDWPDLPVVCDNNLLAASNRHFDRVIERLVSWEWADFNQGLDARLLTPAKAKLLAKIKRPMIRLALDSAAGVAAFLYALNTLLDAGISKCNIRAYCLIAFDTGPREAWNRCEFIERHVKALAMWYHALDQLHENIVTEQQAALGWTEAERTRIMGYYYMHRGEVPEDGEQRHGCVGLFAESEAGR